MKDELRDAETQEMLERVTGEYNVDVVRREGEFEKKKAQSLALLIGISFFSIILPSRHSILLRTFLLFLISLLCFPAK